MLNLIKGVSMSNFVFNNLLDMCVIREVDVILFYNNHCRRNGLSVCKNLDDIISLLIDCKFIALDEIQAGVIEYYKQHFSKHPQKAIHIVQEYIQTENPDFLPDALNLK